MGVKENTGEQGVMKKFEEDVRFIDNRNEVKLPFKDGHSWCAQSVGQTYIMCVLESRNGTLISDSELLKMYPFLCQILQPFSLRIFSNLRK